MKVVKGHVHDIAIAFANVEISKISVLNFWWDGYMISIKPWFSNHEWMTFVKSYFKLFYSWMYLGTFYINMEFHSWSGFHTFFKIFEYFFLVVEIINIVFPSFPFKLRIILALWFFENKIEILRTKCNIMLPAVRKHRAEEQKEKVYSVLKYNDVHMKLAKLSFFIKIEIYFDSFKTAYRQSFRICSQSESTYRKTYTLLFSYSIKWKI